MASLIERYVYDVTRRLPEKDREEVGRELSANIYDMLSDNPSNDEIAGVLNGLGSPRVLAEKYRQKPNYLISPAVYYEYIRVLKWIVPLIGGVLLVVGMILGAFESLEQGSVSASKFIGNLISKGLTLGISAAFQALFWVTVGFIIADRTGAVKVHDHTSWTIENLPKEVVADKNRIPISDSIVELVVVSVVFVASILFLTGVISYNSAFFFIYEGTAYTIREFFAPNFLALLLTTLVIGCALEIVVAGIKIAQCRWTPLVCAAVLINNAVGIVLLVILVVQPEILSQQFLAFAETKEWWQVAAVGLDRLILNILVGITMVATLVNCGTTLYKTMRAHASSAHASSQSAAAN